MPKCAICCCDVDHDEAKHLKIKGNVKDICKECVIAVKGLE